MPTKNNPADLLSRGLSPLLVKDCSLWWHGPEWLLMTSYSWPTLPMEPTKPVTELKYKPIICINSSTQHYDVLDRFSSLFQMKRIMAYCRRFSHNCFARKRKEDRRLGRLTSLELHNTLNWIIKLKQMETLSVEYINISTNKPIPKNSKLVNLNPFIDSNG